jgi:hypothetical protein
MSLRSAWLGILVSLQLVGACGGGASDPAPIPAKDLAVKLADLYCGGYAPCCRDVGVLVDDATCKQQMTAAFTKDTAIDRPNIRYDAVAAGRCLDVLSRMVSDCTISDSEIRAQGDVCTKVFVGVRKLGEPCDDFSECAPVADAQVGCPTPAAGGSSVCTISARLGHLGESCSFACDDLSNKGGCLSVGQITDGAYCWASDGLTCSSSQSTCQPLPAAGQACELACQSGFFCDGSTAVCRKKLGTGVACHGSDECSEGECESGVCVPRKLGVAACESIFSPESEP